MKRCRLPMSFAGGGSRDPPRLCQDALPPALSEIWKWVRGHRRSLSGSAIAVATSRVSYRMVSEFQRLEHLRPWFCRDKASWSKPVGWSALVYETRE